MSHSQTRSPIRASKGDDTPQNKLDRASTTLCDRIKTALCSLCCSTRPTSRQQRRQERPLLASDSYSTRGDDAADGRTTARGDPSDKDEQRRRNQRGSDPVRLRSRPVLARPPIAGQDPTATRAQRKPSAQVDPGSWIASLPDHVQLDTLYLAGTHQSLARNYPLASSLCQTTSLTHQLENGIRALDLRFSLREEDGTLWAYHGPVPQRREMSEVFDEIYRFLETAEGRRETILVSLKQENAAHGFAEAVWNLIDSTRPTLWYDRNVWPTLDQVRGRCVMFCRFGFQSGRGLHPPIWPNDKRYLWKTEIGGRETVVQDWYGVRSPLSLPEKADLALSLFHPSSPAMLALEPLTSIDSHSASPSQDEPRPVPYRINFLSCGSFPTLYPSHAAKGFGAPKFGVGYRGVNALVASGLETRRRRVVEAKGLEISGSAVSEGDRDAPDCMTHDSDELSGGVAPLPPPATAEPEEEKPRPLRPQPVPPPMALPTRNVPTLDGQQRRDGHGGMLVFLDFWESPRKSRLVDQIIEMNF